MTVFANGLEISAQAQGAKVIAAFPDVCFTPPLTPATPPGVPIPYPNFGMDSDLASGSGTVKIGGKPVSQENASYYKKISGDEAGAAPKKSVITSKNMGKAYAQMWSMDVKVEGKGVARFSDIMTTNHASNVGSAPPFPEIAGLNVGSVSCTEILAEVGLKVHAYRHAADECEPKKSADGSDNPKYQQSDHILQNACFVDKRTAAEGIPTCKSYHYLAAPCVCLEDATTKTTEHGRKTQAQNDWASGQRAKPGKPNPTYEEVREANLEAMKKAKPEIADKGDEEHPAIECLRAVCDAFFLPKMDDKTGKGTQCRTPYGGKFDEQPPAIPTSSPVDL
jgi:hypothetical protein